MSGPFCFLILLFCRLFFGCYTSTAESAAGGASEDAEGSVPLREPVMVRGIGRVLPWVPGTERSKRIRNHQRSSSSVRGQSIHTQGGRGRRRLPGGCGGLVEDRLPLHKQSPWCSSPSASPSSNTDAAPWNCDCTRQRGSPSPQRQKAAPSIGFGTGSVVLCSSAGPSPPVLRPLPP